MTMNEQKIGGIKVREAASTRYFHTFGYIFVLLLSIVCVLPFIILVSGSFSAEQAILFHGFKLWPQEFTLEAYETLFHTPMVMIRSYGVTIFITAVGTTVSLFVTAMTGYVLSRKDFLYRNKIAFFFYFTTLFNGGLVGTYIFIIKYLHLKDSFAALIFPHMINVFNLLIMRSFMASLQTEVIESAKVDGAGEFRIFIQLILPLAKAGLATIGLFTALYYWNDWYSAMLYITSSKKFPLQYMLYDMLSRQDGIEQMAAMSGITISEMPSQSLKMAMSVVATGPIVLLYPAVQKYFVKGITVGAVKG